MAKLWLSIFIFFTLVCLCSLFAVFGPDILREESSSPLQNNKSFDSLDQNWTARIENLEENQEDLIKIDLEQRPEISAQNKTLENLTGVLSFVQNELESKAGENETAILDKELKDIRREFEELKENGSNLSSLPKNIAHTTTCGGFIIVENEHEIRYQVPPQQNRNESEPQFCIWVVKNSQHQSLVLELKSIEREQHFQLWTIDGFTTPLYSTSKNIRDLGEKYPLKYESYFGLYFRSYYYSRNNAPISFNLNVKSTSYIPYNRQRRIKRIDLSANSTSSLQSFKYPLTPSTGHSANEGTFIILKPTESGSRLWLKMKSVQTETSADFIDIVTFSGRPIFRARLSGNETNERRFRSGADEPMIVFFRSDSSGQLGGFSFDYAEEKQEAVAPTTQNQSTCGGFVTMFLETEISYQVPSNATSSVCIWVVSNELGELVTLRLADQNQWTNPESTELFIVDCAIGRSSQKIPITNNRPSSIFEPFAISNFLLYFRFNPNLEGQNQNDSSAQGFRLRLQDNSQESPTNNLVISQTELTPSSTPTEKRAFSYPIRTSRYQDNERAFIIIKPTAVGSKIKVDMIAMDTEARYDHVQIMSYSERERRMTFDFSFSGTFNEARPRTLKGRENEPFIVYFSSEGSSVRSGFRFTYSEVRTNTIS